MELVPRKHLNIKINNINVKMNSTKSSYEIVVNFIGNDRHVVLCRHLKNIEQMRSSVDRTAWIGWVVYYNGRCVLVDLRLQLLEIHLPSSLRLIE